MATAQYQVRTRPPLRARPRPDADVRVIAAEVSERFPKTLEHLAR